MPVPASYNDITTNSTIRYLETLFLLHFYIHIHITKCEGTTLVGPGMTLSSMFSKDGKTPEWCSGQCKSCLFSKELNYLCFSRFGSVHYTAMVYLNGQFVTDHSGGHLPFEADVTDVLRYSEKYNFQKILLIQNDQTLSGTYWQLQWITPWRGSQFPRVTQSGGWRPRATQLATALSNTTLTSSIMLAFTGVSETLRAKEL